MMISKQDVYDAEDAWSEAVENHGAESPEAEAAWEEYQNLSAARDAQMEEEPEW